MNNNEIVAQKPSATNLLKRLRARRSEILSRLDKDQTSSKPSTPPPVPQTNEVEAAPRTLTAPPEVVRRAQPEAEIPKPVSASEVVPPPQPQTPPRLKMPMAAVVMPAKARKPAAAVPPTARQRLGMVNWDRELLEERESALLPAVAAPPTARQRLSMVNWDRDAFEGALPEASAKGDAHDDNLSVDSFFADVNW